MRTARLIALVTGLVAVVLAVLTPLLPVKQQQAAIDWPQPGAASLEAPLVSYAPLSLEATIPCTALTANAENLLSTIPAESSDAASEGLVVRVATADGTRPPTVQVTLRDNPLLAAPVAEVAGCREIRIDSTAALTTAEFVGSSRADGTPFRGEVGRDIRPQVVGLFTDLDAGQLAGAQARVDIDSRFSSSPGALKLAAIVLAILCTIASLVALHILDGTDRRRPRRFLPAHWWRFTGVDGVVFGVLVLWHFIGANTSDDGYILNMARVAERAQYMANYYRWFGVPEAPFGWSYDVLELFARVSTASPWMRLPTLIAAILCWMVISREVLPRLGTAVRRNKVALWTGGLVFLAFWLPYDNGLRPEPVIALGALLTWCSIERAIATGRLLPAAIAILIAAFSLAAGPTGLICITALIAGSRPMLHVLIKRGRIFEEGGSGFRTALRAYTPLIAPLLAAGTVVLVVIFADQTLASVMEATRVRTAVGPNVVWFDERVRWDALMTVSPDGSLARRFGVFVMLLCLAVCVLQVLRKGGRIPGTSRGPSARILGIVFASLVLMMFTPTKWTHHFGVYAGLAGSLGALAAVAVGQAAIRSPRNRTLFAAAVTFVLALCFTSSNGWWYVSSYGIPWFDKPPSIAGKGFSTGFLGLTVLLLLLAAWQHYREPYRRSTGSNGRARRLAPAPLTVAAAFVVLFEVLSFVKGAVERGPAYSIASSNFRSLAGDTCGMADDVLVERDPNSTMLMPLNGDVANGLDADRDGAQLAARSIGNDGETGERSINTGFTPNGVAEDLTADEEETAAGGANTVTTDKRTTTSTTGAGTGGGTEQRAGVNGSTVALPFGLDPARVPVLGSYQTGEQQQASLTTQWYGLDRSGLGPNDKILAITAAGRIRSVDADGVVTYGQDLTIEYGTRTPTGVETRGSVVPLDIGPSPSWRNLRVPLADIPADADAVRIVAVDNDITERQWLAITPPRVPQVETLDSVVGRTTPVLLDWSVGLAFPCQRPFGHRDGVAEVPEYRILPDRTGADATNAWQDDVGGGPLGWTELLLSAETIPTYLDDDWRRDWGSLERFTPLDTSAVPASVSVSTATRTGLWRPAPIRTD
ncbi:MAG: arabinosyltransferase [Aldersonia sp.]|nr:arabinosyltransferase [Aldersonia sp.]